MGSRISPEDNSVPLLLKLQPVVDKNSLISIAMDVPEVGLERIPVKLMIHSKSGVKVKPKRESIDMVKASNQAVQMVIGYKAGGGKMKSVVPKKRKLVKTMMYHSIKDFVVSLFHPPSAGAPP